MLNKNDSVEKRLQVLLRRYNDGEWEEVVKEATKLIKKFPSVLDTYNLLGATFHKLENFSGSLESYKVGLIIQPKQRDVYNNLGNTLISMSKDKHALCSFQKATILDPKFAQGFFNIGNLFSIRKEFDLAIANFEKILSFQRGFPELHNNLGLALKNVDQFDQAIANFREAIALNNNYAEAYNNLGISLKEKGDVQQAITMISKAVEINPGSSEGFYNLGEVYWKAKSFLKALACYRQALRLEPEFHQALVSLSSTLPLCRFSRHDAEIENILIKILRTKTIGRPSSLLEVCISLLKSNLQFQKLLNEIISDEQNITSTVLSKLSKISLLTELMRTSVITDKAIEEMLRRCRKYILINYKSLSESNKIKCFSEALAVHCFITEYIFEVSGEEKAKLAELILDIESDISKGRQFNNLGISIIASYQPLHSLVWHNSIHFDESLTELSCQQIRAAEEELVIRDQIVSLTKIEDRVSKQVRDQYEEYPYPRWVNLNLSHIPVSMKDFFENRELIVPDQKIFDLEKPSLLIAGCGTGQHAIESSMNFKNSNVMAIDISLRSLSYAERKTREFGITNLKYAHADILELAEMEQKFDVIECMGVLHHLEDPLMGLAALEKVLRPAGLIKIGLYSKVARKNISRLRAKYKGFSGVPSKNDMLSIRREIILSEEEDIKVLHESLDFYSLSALKDLIFHVKEHNFDALELKQILNKMGLTFFGFVFENPLVIPTFKEKFPKEKSELDLENWNEFEINNPSVFANMYQFWCQKNT